MFKTRMQRHTLAPDYQKLLRVTEYSHTLATAFYFTRNEKYAKKAAAKLRSFFTNKQTGMLPHMLYAQLKPDVQQGSPQVREPGQRPDNASCYLPCAMQSCTCPTKQTSAAFALDACPAHMAARVCRA
jgi:hypothetical protein